MATCTTSWNSGKDSVTDESELLESTHDQSSLLEATKELIKLQEITNAYLQAIVGYNIKKEDT